MKKIELIKNILYVSIALILIVLTITFQIISKLAIYENQILIHVLIIWIFIVMLTYSLWNKNIKKTWLISLAILFAFVGELIYDWAPSSWSYYGLSLYGATAICLICFLSIRQKFNIKQSYSLSIFVALWIIFTTFMVIWGNTTNVLVNVAFAIYSLLLCVVVWRSICLDLKNKFNWIIIVGCVLWFISDTLLMCGTLYIEMNNYPLALDIVLWITIRCGFFLIATIGNNPFYIKTTKEQKW